MSYLKDAKLIKTIAETEGYSELSEEACQYILADAELLLRRLVISTAKATRRFSRTKSKPEDVEIAVDSLNLNFLTVGSSSTTANTYFRADNSMIELDQTPVPIMDKISDILKTKLLRKHKIELNFEWLHFGGKLNPRIEKATMKTMLEARAPKASQAVVPAKQPFEQFAAYDHFMGGNSKAVYLIKEVSPDVLTKEANNFVGAYRETLESYFEKIDAAQESIDYKRLNYSEFISVGGRQNASQNPGADPLVHLLHQPTARALTRTSRF